MTVVEGSKEVVRPPSCLFGVLKKAIVKTVSGEEGEMKINQQACQFSSGQPCKLQMRSWNDWSTIFGFDSGEMAHAFLQGQGCLYPYSVSVRSSCGLQLLTSSETLTIIGIGMYSVHTYDCE